MPRLLPFPHYHRPPGPLAERLPFTRHGVRHLPPGALRKQPGPAHALLTIRDGERGRRVRGLCGLLPARAFRDGSVLPHEHTLESRMDRQRRLVRADRGALGKPVLLTLPSLTEVFSRIASVDEDQTEALTFYGDDHIYRLQCLRTEGAIDLGPTPPIIADGHHRAATHAELAERGDRACEYIPVVAIGADELRIGAFLRVIDGGGLGCEELLNRLTDFFSLQPLDAPRPPDRTGCWLLHHDGKSYHLRRKNTEVGDTDPGWLNRKVLPAIFGITDTRTDPRIESVDPPARQGGLCKLSSLYAGRIQLLGYPVSRAEFFTEVLAGRVLPPKSTRFEPRVPSGLLVWCP